MLWVGEWHWWWSPGISLECLFNFFDLVLEEFIDHVSSFLVNEVLDQWSLGQRVKVFKHFNSIRNSRDVLESKLNDILVHNF